jgi:glyoxylase-like metal-dependent hydrolase (beta-lactamase superfamily II)
MRIHHLNCGVTEPFGGALMGGTGHPLRKVSGLSHCLLVETSRDLVLIDSGFGMGDIEHPAERLGRRFVRLARPVLDPGQTALAQLTALGYAPGDLRHIVLTHLDPDHAGGISDFPQAKVHVLADAHRAAAARPGRHERARARANQLQWAHGPDWVTYDAGDGERWFGLEGARPLRGLPPDILLMPLPGHSHGHAGVAVRSGGGPGSATEWVLHAGDAYFFHGQLDHDHPSAPAGIRLFEKRQQVDAAARADTQARLRVLVSAHSDQVEVISGHDRSEFDRHLPRPSAPAATVSGTKKE